MRQPLDENQQRAVMDALRMGQRAESERIAQTRQHWLGAPTKAHLWGAVLGALAALAVIELLRHLGVISGTFPMPFTIALAGFFGGRLAEKLSKTKV